jgi:hypothetical protein
MIKSNKKKSSLFLIGLILNTALLEASEVDNFTLRLEPIEEASDSLNRKTNQLLEQALSDANHSDEKNNKHCVDKNLYYHMKKQTGGETLGKLEKYINTHREEFDAKRIKIGKSIYKGFLVLRLMNLIPTFNKKGVAYGATLKVGDVQIGSDKFGHFHAQGMIYFEKAFLQGLGIQAALDWGYAKESGSGGVKTTNVYSSGDLTANFNGMRFWTHLLAKYPDPLRDDPIKGPYIICQDNIWVKVKSFDWKDYIDDSFDESINCSQFRTKRLATKIKENLSKLHIKLGHKFDCPMTRDNLPSLKIKYGPYFRQIFNDKGHQKFMK